MLLAQKLNEDFLCGVETGYTSSCSELVIILPMNFITWIVKLRSEQKEMRNRKEEGIVIKKINGLKSSYNIYSTGGNWLTDNRGKRKKGNGIQSNLSK